MKGVQRTGSPSVVTVARRLMCRVITVLMERRCVPEEFFPKQMVGRLGKVGGSRLQFKRPDYLAKLANSTGNNHVSRRVLMTRSSEFLLLA